ncbi:MAG: restriction endonuclease subunit S, partial [Spirochaetes bacterium]|nr:restriction endonuclease subunit S [Spirochaetota bacterium]
ITPCFENSKSCIMVNLLNGYGAGTTELFVLRCNDLILSKYLYYIIKSTDFIENGKNFMTGTAGQQRIPRWYIENYIIPLPPLEEQNEIVRRVEKLFALADSLEAKYKKAYERVEKLEQAILAKAFRGELVKPDPNDEPAEELLKRILEEKAKLEDGKKSKRRRTKNVE